MISMTCQHSLYYYIISVMDCHIILSSNFYFNINYVYNIFSVTINIMKHKNVAFQIKIKKMNQLYYEIPKTKHFESTWVIIS